MPVIALIKVLAMRSGYEGRWSLAHFGTIDVREPQTKVYRRQKNAGRIARYLRDRRPRPSIYTDVIKWKLYLR